MPNRIIKESIRTSDNLDELTFFQECFFYRLLVSCDDYGRFDARAKILKSALFPLKDDVRANQIEDALQALTLHELVDVYEVDGKPFLQVKSWEAHQQIRAKKSKYPAPVGQSKSKVSKSKASANICNHMISDDSKCSRNPIQSESNPNPNTEETRTRERATTAAIDDFDLSADIERNKIADEMIHRYGMTDNAITFGGLLEDLERHGEEKVRQALEKAASGNSRGKVSLNYYRAILNNGGSSQSRKKVPTQQDYEAAGEW